MATDPLSVERSRFPVNYDLTVPNAVVRQDLVKQLQARTEDLHASIGRQADLDATIFHLRRSLAAAVEREAGLQAEIDALPERFEAMRAVADICSKSGGFFGFRRRHFLTLLRRAAGALPAGGPETARALVFLSEARRVLGLPAD